MGVLSRCVVVSGLLMAGICQAAAPQFGPAASYNLGDQAGALVAADFNGDGYADAAAVNDVPGTVTVVFNDKKGAFGPAASYAACAHPTWMVSGDVNRDKRADLVVGCTGTLEEPQSIAVLKNKGDGTFASPVTYAVAVQMTSIELLDVDGANGPDIIVGHGNDMVAGGGSIGLLTNNGDGTFSGEVIKDAGSGAINALALIDLDGDAQLDVLALGNDGCCNTNRWLKFDRDIGAFRDATNFGGFNSGINGWPSCAAVADLNGDGLPDMVIGDAFKFKVYSVVAKGDGTFAQAEVDAGGFPCPVAIGDLNQDGNPDVLAGTYMLLNDGFGMLWPVVDPDNTHETWAVAADLDRDTDLDVLSINSDTGALSVRTNLAVAATPGADATGSGSSGGGGSAGLPSALTLAAAWLLRHRRTAAQRVP